MSCNKQVNNPRKYIKNAIQSFCTIFRSVLTKETGILGTHLLPRLWRTSTFGKARIFETEGWGRNGDSPFVFLCDPAIILGTGQACAGEDMIENTNRIEYKSGTKTKQQRLWHLPHIPVTDISKVCRFVTGTSEVGVTADVQWRACMVSHVCLCTCHERIWIEKPPPTANSLLVALLPAAISQQHGGARLSVRAVTHGAVMNAEVLSHFVWVSSVPLTTCPEIPAVLSHLH